MKLLFCSRCWDVFKLAMHETRRCECGQVAGKYLPDGHHAVTNGKGFSIAVANGDLEKALFALKVWEHETKEKTVATTQEIIDSHFKLDYKYFIDVCRIKRVWVRPNGGNGNPRQSIQEDL